MLIYYALLNGWAVRYISHGTTVSNCRRCTIGSSAMKMMGMEVESI